MKGKIWIVLIIMLVISTQSASILAKNIPNGRSGKSNIAHLYLFEKDPVSWQIIENGSWGKMKYEISGEEFDYVFNGHNLSINASYSLIYYPDPWPGKGLICLGSGLVNEDGNIHISEEINTGTLPFNTDNNSEWGAKIWLVLSEDVDCQEAQMIGWSPNLYLFEYDAIRFIDTDDMVEDLSEPENEANNTIPEESNDTREETNITDLSETESLSKNDVVTSENDDVKAKEIKTKFIRNREKLICTFFNVLEKMYDADKEELPPGIQKITSYFFMS